MILYSNTIQYHWNNMIYLDICETLLQSARSPPLIGAERRNVGKLYRQWAFPDDSATFYQPSGHPNRKKRHSKKHYKIRLQFRVSNFVQRNLFEVPFWRLLESQKVSPDIVLLRCHFSPPSNNCATLSLSVRGRLFRRRVHRSYNSSCRTGLWF